MQDLNFEVVQTAGKIECNLQEIKEAVAVQMSAYEDAVVTEDTIPSYKGELATLRKIYKAVDDKRKDIKNEYLKPYEQFEAEVKSVLEEINKPIDLINRQLKLFEEDRVLKKQERVSKMYLEQVAEYTEYLPIEQNYNPKWNNKSTTDTDIKFEISEKLLKVKNDISVIKSLGSEIESEILETYKKSGNDLAKAIERNTQYLSDKRTIEQANKESESKVETKETVVETKENPLEGSKLNEMVQMTKTARIIVSMDDLAQVEELLGFSGISYRVEK